MRYLWTERIVKHPWLTLYSWKQGQFELVLETLFLELEERPTLYLSLLMMTLLFLSFEEFPPLFIALELISGLEECSFTFFHRRFFHNICARFHSKLSSLYLFKRRSMGFEDQGTSGDTLCHFKRRKSWKSLEVFLVFSLLHFEAFPFDFLQNVLFLWCIDLFVT